MNPDELQAFLGHMDEAMGAEDIPEVTRKRIVNRLIFGRPEGYRPWVGTHEVLISRMSTQDPGSLAVLQAEEREHEVAPAEPAIWFGPDDREVPFGEVEAYPVISNCRCGRMIAKEEARGQWRHTD